MPHTHTQTFTRRTYADPYLACAECGARVEWSPEWPPEAEPRPLRNEPCGHEAEMVSTCPSWSPVDGCRCVEHLGARPFGHLPEPEAVPA